MGKNNGRLEAARQAYREALEAARTSPTPEAWARLLAAGKELSSVHEPKQRTSRRNRRSTTPTYQDLEGPAQPEAHEIEQLE